MFLDPGPSIPFAILDGHVVEKDALRVAEAISDYDPNLMVICNTRPDGPEDPPFIVAERCTDGHVRPVMTAWELNDLLLERIRISDTQRSNVLQTLENMEKKAKADAQSRYQERRMEAADKTKHILGLKSHYTVRDEQTGELIHFYDDRPSKRTGGT